MRHIYYYVEPCPRCGSRKTGRYMKMPFTGSGFTKTESLKAGELIRFAQALPDKNGFCSACGYEWHTRVETKWWPDERIREEKAARGTEALYATEKKTEKPAEPLWRRRKHEPEPEEAPEYEEYENNDEEEYEFIDSRRKDVIELLYADERLIRKILNQNQAEGI